MATVPYAFECDRQSGFVPDPNEHKRVGYITELAGFDMSAPLARDLTVSLPGKNLAPAFKSPVSANNTVKVVGVMEKFEWSGGVGDSLQIDFLVSPETVSKIQATLQSPQKSTLISGFEFWIANYDHQANGWYEEFHPSSGLLRGTVKNLSVDPTPQSVKDGTGSNVNVRRVTIEIAPAANQTMHFSLAIPPSAQAASPIEQAIAREVKPWGLPIAKPL